jgi:hypothetical protein
MRDVSQKEKRCNTIASTVDNMDSRTVIVVTRSAAGKPGTRQTGTTKISTKIEWYGSIPRLLAHKRRHVDIE